MPISGRRISPAGIRPVPSIPILLLILVIPACVFFQGQELQRTEPPQLLFDPDLEDVVRMETASGRWKLDADPETPGLRSGPMQIRRTRGLGISQQASDADPWEVNAWTQRIDDPPVGEWYRFYLEFGLEEVSDGGVRIDLRFYSASGELILSNGWSPEISGTVPIYWGETTGEIPEGCAWIDVVAGLKRSASGTFVLQEARLELHDPVVQSILTGESRFFNGRLHLALKTSGGNTIGIRLDLETGTWLTQYGSLPHRSTYTLRGRSLDLKLALDMPYREEGGYEVIGTQTYWIRGEFGTQSPVSVGGVFNGVFIVMSTIPNDRDRDMEGSVTGYLTLNGARVDSIRTRPLHQGRQPPPVVPPD